MPEAPPAPSAAVDATLAPHRWRRRLGIAALALVLLVALGVGVAYLVLPGFLKGRLEEVLTAEFGRRTTVERVAVRPFALAATVHGLTVLEPDGTAPALTVDAIEADFSGASVWQRAPIVDALRILRPHLRVARVAEGRYSFSDLLDRWLSPSTDPPARFSLNNVEVHEGRIDVDDRPHQRRHQVDGVEIGLPFLSSLPYAAEVKVTPRLAARVNGTPFALAGDATPFAPTREAALNVDLDALPLANYVDYLPVRLRYRLVRAALTTRLKVTFAQPPGVAPTIAVAGSVQLADVDLQRRDGAPLVALAKADVAIERIDPQARLARIGRVAVDRPRLALRREADGRVELAADPFVASAPAQAAVPAWRVEVADVVVAGGTAAVEDASVQPVYRINVVDFSLRAQGLATAPNAAGRLEAALATDDGAKLAAGATVVLAPFGFKGRVDLAGASLARLYPYAADVLDLEVQRGVVDFGADVDYTGGARPSFHLRGGKAGLRDVALAARDERVPLWRVPRIDLDAIDVDAAARRVRVGAFVAHRPVAQLRREADGDFNYARLLRQRGPAPAESAAVGDAWQVGIDRVALERATLDFEDRTTSPAVRIAFDDVEFVARSVGNVRGEKSTIDLRARAGKTGRLAVKGSLATAPIAVDWRIEAEGLPVLPLRPYWQPRTDLVVTGGTVGARGQLKATMAPGGAVQGSWSGDLSVLDAGVIDAQADDLAKWRVLAVDGMTVRLDPFDLAIAKLTLADFYARIIVFPDGTVNLQRLGKTGAAAAAPTAAAGRQPRPGARAGARSAGGTGVAAAAATAERTLRRVADGALPIAVGRIALERGNVYFSDFFVRPNYSANLTQLDGTVSSLAPTQPGEIALTAKLDDAAPVEISGRVQPFAREITFDLAGKARDIELPPLSPYSAKYAGYGIAKGKMSFEVAYKVVERRLEAQNRLVLDQLTFGERVESPEATKLPVLLAVALLKDANGVIDLDLPISGTLDDPQFSVFGLIVRVVTNLVAKAATAPFAVLAAAAGAGTADLSRIDFAPGTAVLGTEAGASLDKLAAALKARPGLKVDVTGHADPATDREALTQAALLRALQTAKYKALAGSSGAPASVEATTIAPDERARWVAAAYKDAPIAERPRNFVGMLKDVPQDEMERMLAAHGAASEAAVAELALRRAQVAKDALVSRGVATERVFLVAAGGATAAAPATRRVDFALR